jgi:hypothetical protein
MCVYSFDRMLTSSNGLRLFDAAFGPAYLPGPFDPDRSDRDAVVLLEKLVLTRREAIDANQVASGITTDLIVEELADRRPLGNVEMIGEAATEMIDEKDPHMEVPLVEVELMDVAAMTACRGWGRPTR